MQFSINRKMHISFHLLFLMEMFARGEESEKTAVYERQFSVHLRAKFLEYALSMTFALFKREVQFEG